jgi:Protein of unknown function (DUF3313)
MWPLSMAAACTLLIGCASPEPVAYRDIASASYLKPNKQDESGRVPYRYGGLVDWKSYSRAIFDPVDIYRGADHQFGDLSPEDRAALAKYMEAEFAERLATRFAITKSPDAGTLRIKATLTGAATNTPVLSTFTRFDLAGGLYNGVEAVRGREGMMTGSVIYAVEIYDAATDRLLDAYVTKQYPGAYNVMAGLGSLAAAKTGIDKGADALLDEFR